ncbi:hypothetical protein DPMN_119698 [Dreissena polymorpha]|uniref:Uncharacterized protein n=1 Tax=Dreissena polymorpha TaxID=45954 RepID=A0A9D4GQE0_DREPO|nr:hypothetical protein DPMN_119698 [Dreissena polymorpha]
MHLQAISDCISVFAAAVHFNYLRSSYNYLQQMSSLDKTHSDFYQTFVDDVHVVRRSKHVLFVHNTKTQLRRASTEMLLISRKCIQKYNLFTLQR